MATPIYQFVTNNAFQCQTKISLQSQYFDFVSTTASLNMAYVKSKCRILAVEGMICHKYRSNIHVSSPYSLKKISVYHPPSAVSPCPSFPHTLWKSKWK